MFKFIMPSFKIKVEKWKWNKEYRVYVSNMGHFKDEYERNLPIKINQNGNCGGPLRRTPREKGCVQSLFFYFYKKICYNIYVNDKER